MGQWNVFSVVLTFVLTCGNRIQRLSYSIVRKGQQVLLFATSAVQWLDLFEYDVQHRVLPPPAWKRGEFLLDFGSSERHWLREPFNALSL